MPSYRWTPALYDLVRKHDLKPVAIKRQKPQGTIDILKFCSHENIVSSDKRRQLVVRGYLVGSLVIMI